MKTTKQLANEMADQVFQIRDAYIENKKAKHNRIMSVVKLAAPAAACFGLAMTLGINYLTKYSKISEVEVQPAITIVSDSIAAAVSDNSKTSSTTVVTADKTVSAAVKADKSRSGNGSSEENTEYDSSEEYTMYDNTEEYIEYDSNDSTEEESTISTDVSAVSPEIKKPLVTSAPTQTKGKTITKITAASVTKAAVLTTEVTQTESVQTTEPMEIPEPTADSRDEEITMAIRRVYDRIEDMDNGDFRSNLAGLYKELSEILNCDPISDESIENALNKLHEKEVQMGCLFPRATDIINYRSYYGSERLTLEQALAMIGRTDNFNKLYWELMGYCPDVLEDFGFSGKREYWLDDLGIERIVFYPLTREVIYYNYNDETLIYPQ